MYVYVYVYVYACVCVCVCVSQTSSVMLESALDRVKLVHNFGGNFKAQAVRVGVLYGVVLFFELFIEKGAYLPICQ